MDLDDDGRMDVLLTHGDSFDDQIVKPYTRNPVARESGLVPLR